MKNIENKIMNNFLKEVNKLKNRNKGKKKKINSIDEKII